MEDTEDCQVDRTKCQQLGEIIELVEWQGADQKKKNPHKCAAWHALQQLMLVHLVALHDIKNEESNPTEDSESERINFNQQ